jgi:hypothetical protein
VLILSGYLLCVGGVGRRECWCKHLRSEGTNTAFFKLLQIVRRYVKCGGDADESTLHTAFKKNFKNVEKY